MTAFINTPLRKIKSDPLILNKLTPIRISRSDTNLLHMAMVPISPKSIKKEIIYGSVMACLLYTSPSPRDGLLSRMPSSA